MRGRRQNARAEAEAQPRLPVPAYKPRMRPAGPQLNPSSSWLGAATSLRQEEAPALVQVLQLRQLLRGLLHAGVGLVIGVAAASMLLQPTLDLADLPLRHLHLRRELLHALLRGSPAPLLQTLSARSQQDAVTAVLTAQGLQRHHLRVCCACVDCLQPSPHDQVTQRHRSPARDLGKHPNPEVVDEGAVELEELLDELPVQVERDDVSALRHHDAAEEVGKVGADGLWPSRALLAQELPERKGHVGVVVVQDHEDVALLPLVRMSTEPLKSAQEFCARAKVLLH
eukprot:CAMPEP_0171165898 /NCGR_PEP_ID=MMETSP0790-20130122/6417_1 /TAXON_ID=2925 /ORGANISM="Alexandrium catenella, Strain OF101" /LENGTH=283 /DNA_ID=CAMNT_0011630691 /DNA_START=12 /DNA_END=864 /DNA_ORIENTATION=-